MDSATHLLNNLGLINFFVILSSGPVTICKDRYQRLTKYMVIQPSTSFSCLTEGCVKKTCRLLKAYTTDWPCKLLGINQVLVLFYQDPALNVFRPVAGWTKRHLSDLGYWTRRPPGQVPLWLPAGFVQGSPKFKSSTTLENSQLDWLRPVWIFNHVMFALNYLFQSFARPHEH